MRPALPAVMLALVLMACSGSPQEPVGATDVYLDEFFITVDGPLATGTVDLSVTNDGEFAHTLLVTGPDGSVIAATELVAPGTTVDLGLDLPPGRYRLSCRIVVQDRDGGIIDHFEEGMRAGVEVVDT
jgi:hypothetical protein